MLQGLRKKFVTVTMLLTTLLLCIFLNLIYNLTAANLAAENIRTLQSVSISIGRGTFKPENPRPDDRLHYFILSCSPKGDLIVSGNMNFDLSNTAQLKELYETVAANEGEYGVLKQYSLRWCRAEGTPGRTYIFMDISKELAALRTLRNSCILIGLAAVLVLLILVQLLVRWIMKPAERAWQQQKQFVADASHELKTPLTVIMTNAELLSSPEYTPNQKQAFAEHIHEMSVRMRSLIDGLLDLARLDGGVVKSAFTQLDYSALTDQALLPFEPLYFESGRMLESRIDPDIRLTGSEDHLRQLIVILLDNAMKYSYEGSTVLLTLEKQSRYALLCVDSPGAPLSKPDQKQIFQRFYTVDKSRSSSSYGLGLSIARSIVGEHKGKIWAESAGEHNKFYVKLPILTKGNR